MPRPSKGQRIAGSGRKPGQPNKVTRDLIEFFDSKGMFIPQMIVDRLPDLEIDNQMRVLLELMQYLYPKRKAVELTSPEENGFSIVIKDYTK